MANLGPESHRIGVCMASSLHSAAMQGHADVVTALLEAGAIVDAVNKQGQTPLHVTAGQGHADVARALLAAGAIVEVVNKQGDTPLHYAGIEAVSYTHLTLPTKRIV